MSRAHPRGEISPFTAAVVTFAILAASGLSVWHFVIRDTASSFAMPATEFTQSGSHGARHAATVIPAASPKSAK
jgi:hypothetical protein